MMSTDHQGGSHEVQFFVCVHFGAVLALLVAAPTLATTYTVNVMGDEINGICDGMHCTLREAIIAANQNPGADTINVPAGELLLVVDGGGAGTHEDDCAEGDLDIRDDLTIVGAGRDATIIDGNGLDRVFHIIYAGTVNLVAMTIRGGGGITQGGDGGGGIWNHGSDLSVLSCDVVDNRTGSVLGVNYFGGGILVDHSGTLRLELSTVSRNFAPVIGGIGHRTSADLTIYRSTISHNVGVNGAAGGLSSHSLNGVITNSTIAFNDSGDTSGPAIRQYGQLSIEQSTIAANVGLYAISNMYMTDETVTLTNSVVGGACGGNNAGYTFVGGNIFDDPVTCEPGPNDMGVANLHLTGLGDYGGPTETMLPYTFSPVIDFPSADAACTTNDQRSLLARPKDGDNDVATHCDAGAVEFEYGEMIFGDDFEIGTTDQWSSAIP